MTGVQTCALPIYEPLDLTHSSVEFIRNDYVVGVVMEAPGKADLHERTINLAQKIDAKIIAANQKSE